MVLTIFYPPPLGASTASAQLLGKHHHHCYCHNPLSHTANLSIRSIIIIHGLNGDVTKSWANINTKAFWSKDFLPRHVPEARVVASGYNANVVFGNTTADIVDYAKDLLGSLIDK
jgi:hypothetical protein